MTVEDLCCFCRSLRHIKWTTTTTIICALPFVLFFLLINIGVVVLSDICGAVASDTPACAQIGRNVLVEEGSAVDAAIAVMFCEGVSKPKEIGLGGGFTALLYMDGSIEALTATPTAPEKSLQSEDNNESAPRAGGIPGELLGYWEMHRKYGFLPWKRLIEPSIKLCEAGVDISESQFVLSRSRRAKRYIPKKFLYPEAVDGIFKSPTLVQTLKKIANEGADVFYRGELGEAFVQDVQDNGGFLTMNDLRNYTVKWSDDIITVNLPGKKKVFTTPLPSSGVIVAMAMNIIKPYKDFHEPFFWHRVVEASKYALGIGLTLGDYENEPNKQTADIVKKTYDKMLDMDFARDIRKRISNGTALNRTTDYGSHYQQLYTESSIHISVLAPNGDAVCLTSSLLWPMITPFLSKRTGIFWNDQLRAFRMLTEQAPPGRRVKPWKRLLSPHAPVMVFPTYKSRPILTLGATGGPYMPTQIIMALTKFCLLSQNIRAAINSGYLHPHMKKEVIEYDDDNPKKVIDYLKSIGHKLQRIGDRLRHFGIVAIENINDMPVPEISARHIGGKVKVTPKRQSMSSFYFTIAICIVLSLLALMLRDYLKPENHIYIANGNEVHMIPF